MIRKNLRIFYFLIIASLLVAPTAQGAGFTASDTLGHVQNGAASFILNSSNNAPNSGGFYLPVGVAVDEENHRLFVADQTNNRILVFALTNANIIQNATSSYVLGQPDFTGSAAGTSSSTLSAPHALTYDVANDRLFVGDAGNNRILAFDVAPATMTNGKPASYVLGQADFDSSVANVSSVQIDSGLPSSLALDAVGQRLFAGDGANSRVLVFDVATSTLANGAAATHVLGQPDFDTSAPGTASASQLSSPVGVGLAFDNANQRLFAGAHRRVLVFDVATSTLANGAAATHVLGQPDFDTTATGAASSSTIGNAAYLTFDNAGQRLFVGDATTNFGSGNNRILVFDVATSTLINGQPAVHVLGQPDLTSFSSPVAPSATQTVALRGIAYETDSGRLFVADGDYNRVLAFAAATITDGEAASEVLGQTDGSGNLTFLYGGANDAPNSTSFAFPVGMAIDTAGHRLFMVDTGNGRVEIFDLDEDNNFEDYVADYVLGEPNFRTNAGGLTDSTLSGPTDVAFDNANQRLFVADLNNSRVLVFDVATSTIANGAAATHVLGQPDFTTSIVGPGIMSPTAIAHDPESDRLFVSDAANSHILVFDVATSTIANGADPVAEFGEPFVVNVTSSTLRTPAGLAYDTLGERLFVGDRDDNRVLVYDVQTGGDLNDISPSIVIGKTVFTNGDLDPTSSSTLSGPWGLDYDAATGRLFVADNSNNRVLGFEAATSTLVNGAAATVVLGQPSFDTSGSGTSASAMNSPQGVALDQSNGRVYVGDTTNNRILRYDPITILTTTLPGATVGELYEQEIATANEQGTVTFSLAAGSLPPGMSLGSVDGTPIQAGTYTFTIQAEDTVSGAGILFDQQEYTLTVTAEAGSIVYGGGSILSIVPSPAPTPAPTPAPSPGPVPAPKPFSQMTVTELQAELARLMALLQQLQSGAPAVCGPWNKNLFFGMEENAEVKALQEFLISKGHLVAGLNTGNYFSLTVKGVKAYQAAKSIVPVSGYFGPLTRAAANAQCAL